MKIILISPPDYIENESSLTNRMFKYNLPLFHLRKPDSSIENLAEYLNSIKQEYHSRIVIHSCYNLLENYNLRGIHITGVNSDEKRSIIEQFKKRYDLSISISYHSLDDLGRNNTGIDYAFLSPAFDSISKRDYKAHFNHKDLAVAVKGSKIDVIALGGCRGEYLKKIKKMGFAGAAFLGAVWNSSDPVKNFLSIMGNDENL
ncbi:MAG: thiamine phosphate synthase [Desulfobacteraceae bacterium]|jgi:thiamine-phosphate pyrophosphorylase